MGIHRFILFLFVAIIIVTSCGPSQEDLARGRLERANVFLENRDTTRALSELDSIAELYPKASYAIGAAKNLRDDINWDLLQRYETELDSIKIQIEELEKNFVKEKTEFDRYTLYTHKRQNFDRRWNKSFLQVHLDERGEIYFSSNYYSEQRINHTGIRVYDGPDQAKTDKVELDDVNNHQSDFLESKWEKVTFRDGKEDGVIEFIANNTERRLKAVFLGDKYYYIILEEYDKRAFREAFYLSKAIIKSTWLDSQIKSLQSSLQIDG